MLHSLVYEEQTDEGLLIHMLEAGGHLNAILAKIETVTDKPTRTRPEITNILEKGGAKIARTNAVMFMFQRKGLFAIPTENISEDKLMEIILEAGADDMATAGDVFEVYSSIENFEPVRKALEEAEIKTTVAELRYLPDNEIEVDSETAQKNLNLIDKLEDNDDVNSVHTNMKFTDEVVKMLTEG